MLRCVGANTQNNNESFNSLVWTLAPKHIYGGKAVVEIANFLATCIFNDGFSNVLKIMDVTGVKIGNAAYDLAVRRDDARLERSDHRASMASKEARIAARKEKASKNELYKEEEGCLYGPGIAD